ncbi:MAG: stage V sporulation protein AD [Ruminococcaceae bacterium]|nr:stage V sporulation protein AD [Oscillospiraceae bacterium]
MKRIGRASVAFDDVSITSFACVGGKMEGDGPLGGKIDKIFEDTLAGEETWEKAESRLVQEASNLCIEKSGYTSSDFDYIFSGDLLNQCTASSFGLITLGIPLIGMYGACSTMASTLLCAAVFTDSGAAERCIAATSSHFASSERQFRNPLRYGGQRPPTAQRTVTGAGAMAVERGGRLRITRATAGIITDLGIADANNMGAAMAPAAASTILRHFDAAGTAPEDYDRIVTGDLGTVGAQLLRELTHREGIDISPVHCDGGVMIFDLKAQDVHAGGSGCGCSATVMCSEILPSLDRGETKRVLFVGTGALMSPTSSQQGNNIPAVAHAVEIERI